MHQKEVEQQNQVNQQQDQLHQQQQLDEMENFRSDCEKKIWNLTAINEKKNFHTLLLKIRN